MLDAATELVRRDGEKVPMADIARHAGVGVGTVYRHFATREDLLGALVHRSFGLAVANARAAAAHPAPRSTAVRCSSPPRCATATASSFLCTAARWSSMPRSASGRPRCATALRGLLERGQAAGELRADLTPDDLILSASLLSRPLPAGDWDLHAGRQIELLLNGLRGPA